jgi:hypothetical protein
VFSTLVQPVIGNFSSLSIDEQVIYITGASSNTSTSSSSTTSCEKIFIPQLPIASDSDLVAQSLAPISVTDLPSSNRNPSISTKSCKKRRAIKKISRRRSSRRSHKCHFFRHSTKKDRYRSRHSSKKDITTTSSPLNDVLSSEIDDNLITDKIETTFISTAVVDNDILPTSVIVNDDLSLSLIIKNEVVLFPFSVLQAVSNLFPLFEDKENDIVQQLTPIHDKLCLSLNDHEIRYINERISYLSLLFIKQNKDDCRVKISRLCREIKSYRVYIDKRGASEPVNVCSKEPSTLSDSSQYDDFFMSDLCSPCSQQVRNLFYICFSYDSHILILFFYFVFF